MSRHPRRWLLVALMLVGLAPVSCGADPALQRRESAVLAKTCASLRERNGDDPAPAPPIDFMSDLLRRAPMDDQGHSTKIELDRRCTRSHPQVPGVTSAP